MTLGTAKRKLNHAFEYLRPFAQGDTAKGIPPNAEALAMSAIAFRLVDITVDLSNERLGKIRYQNLCTALGTGSLGYQPPNRKTDGGMSLAPKGFADAVIRYRKKSPLPKTHTHYRPYFTFKDGREKYGSWHHSKRKAWEEVRKIIHGTDCQWANAECLAQNGYGVESYRVPHSAGDCQGE